MRMIPVLLSPHLTVQQTLTATSVTLPALHSVLLVQLNVAVVWKMGTVS